jgi:hypothetical protein
MTYPYFFTEVRSRVAAEVTEGTHEPRLPRRWPMHRLDPKLLIWFVASTDSTLPGIPGSRRVIPRLPIPLRAGKRNTCRGKEG